jgi:hypothetical protein
MSHYVNLVIGPDPEIQLAGYNEDDCLMFVDLEDAYRKQFAEDLIPVVVFEDGRRCTKYDAEASKYWIRTGRGISTEDKFIIPDDAKMIEIPAPEYFESFEKYMTDWCGFEGRDPLRKRYGKYRNPQAKRDYHTVGGRYDGWLVIKSGVDNVHIIKKGKKENTANIALFKHIDFAKTAVPFAILKGGQWHERGNMGWWGVVSNEKERLEWESEYRSLLADVSENALVSVYDCHI